MKKIINLIKSDNIYLLVIIHVIITLALILFISLKYDWIIEQFGSYTLFVATCAPIGGFFVGGYYFVVDYFRGTQIEIKKVVKKKMYDWFLQNFGSFDNFILFLLAIGLLIVISLMFAALRLTFHDDIETEDKNNERFR